MAKLTPETLAEIQTVLAAVSHSALIMSDSFTSAKGVAESVARIAETGRGDKKSAEADLKQWQNKIDACELHLEEMIGELFDKCKETGLGGPADAKPAPAKAAKKAEVKPVPVAPSKPTADPLKEMKIEVPPVTVIKSGPTEAEQAAAEAEANKAAESSETAAEVAAETAKTN